VREGGKRRGAREGGRAKEEGEDEAYQTHRVGSVSATVVNTNEL